MKSDNVCIILFLIAVFVSSVSQIILKKSALKTHGSIVKEYLNVFVIVSYIMFFLASLMIVTAYSKVPLSMGPILEATGYIWVSVLGVMILKEHINKKKLLGMLLIILGIIAFNL